MSIIIETKRKDTLARIDSRLDRIETGLTDLTIAQTEIKGDLNTLKTELTFMGEDARDFKGRQRAQIRALIGMIFTAVVSAIICDYR